MNLEVKTFVNGRWRQNCYIVTNNEGDALVIDPGSKPEELIALIDDNGWRVHAIVNSHGHYDHIGAVAAIQERYQVPFYLHRADENLLRRANLYRMVFESSDLVRIPTVTHDLSEFPSSFEVGPFSVFWISTPGHTEGSVCLRVMNYLFSGDTLMRGAVGRTDLPGGNREQLLMSVRKLKDLCGETLVFGGHGPVTTIEAEFSPGAPVWSLLQ